MKMVRFVWLLVMALFCTLLASRLYAASGGGGPILDLTFPGSGVALPPTEELMRAALPLPDGRVLVAQETRASRLYANGAPDSTFGDSGFTVIAVDNEPLQLYRLAYDAAGRYLAGGKIGATDTFAVARLAAAGQQDMTFGTSGAAVFALPDDPDLHFRSLAVQGDGRVVGLISGGWPVERSYLFRLTAEGMPDPAFGNGGVVTVDTPLLGGLALHGEGIVLVGKNPAGLEVQRRFYSNGELDPAFGEKGVRVVDLEAEAGAGFIATASEGKIVVAGHHSIRYYAARLLPNGDLDPTFGEDGATSAGAPAWLPELRSMLLDGEHVVLLGSSSSDGGMLLLRFLPNGEPDPEFGEAGFTAALPNRLDPSATMALSPDGAYVIAGERLNEPAVLKLGRDGGAFPGFGPQGYFAVTAYHPGLGARVEQRADGSAFALADYDSSGLVSGFVLRLRPDGSVDTGYGLTGVAPIAPPSPGDYVATDLALDSLGRALVAGYSTDKSHPSATLTRLTPDGALDGTFGGDGTIVADVAWYTSAYAVIAEPGNAVLVATRHLSDTLGARVNVLRFLPDGTIDTTFGTNGRATLPECPLHYEYAPNYQSRLLRSADGRIYLAAHCVDAAAEETRLLRLLPDGDPDPTYGDGGVVRVPEMDGAADLLLQPDGKLLLTGVRWVEPDNRFEWAAMRFTAEGAPDNTFGVGGLFTTSLPTAPPFVPHQPTTLALQPDGKILVAGYVGYATSDSTSLVVRLLADGTLDPDFSSNGVAVLPQPEQMKDFALDGSKLLVIGDTSLGSTSTDITLVIARYDLGEEPPTPTATATASPPATATPSPSATETAGPQGRVLYLPQVRRDTR